LPSIGIAAVMVVDDVSKAKAKLTEEIFGVDIVAATG
jgi:hypothetical protein